MKIRPRRFFWKLFFGHVLLMGIILCVSVWLIVGEVERISRENLTQQMRAQAMMIRQQARPLFESADRDKLQELAAELGAIDDSNIRLTFVAADGTVWADSQADAAHMVPHDTRPEIMQALQQGWGQSERLSATVHREMKYVAVRVGDAAELLGTVRVSMPVPSIVAQSEITRKLIWRIAVLGLGAAIILALGLAYVWSNPIRRITETARSLSAGNLSAHIDVSGQDEISQLAASLNNMRQSLAGQLNTIMRQRGNLESLIHTLTEGVIVVDHDGRIVLMNPVACHLLNIQDRNRDSGRATTGANDRQIDGETYIGKQVEKCIPHPQLLQLLRPLPIRPSRGGARDSGHRLQSESVISSGSSCELRLHVDHPSGGLHLLARGSDIVLSGSDQDVESAPTGRLVVLTDITELTKTIHMKTDFVANASHELRTPLSAIRASVETLLQMNLARDSDSATQFLDVINRHTTRLEELIGDLLDLSRLESPSSEFIPQRFRLSQFLDELHTRFSHAIDEKHLHWKVHCPNECDLLKTSSLLLRLVLDNLLANAIKFTETKGQLRVSCWKADQTLCIEVADDGCGIPLQDQDRVFERFYQVERARSGAGRELAGRRGTGLGLSIVRHAAVAMGAAINLQSTPGKGTRVCLSIPQPSDSDQKNGSPTY